MHTPHSLQANNLTNQTKMTQTNTSNNDLFENMYKTLCDNGQFTIFEFIDFVKERLKENMNQSKNIGDKMQKEMMNRLESGDFASDEHTRIMMQERMKNTHYLCDNA